MTQNTVYSTAKPNSDSASTAKPIADSTIADVVDRYRALWTISDTDERRDAVAALWSPDGVEFVHEIRFEGHEQLTDRVARAYETFFADGTFHAGFADDVTVHQDVVRFTIELYSPSEDDPMEPGELAWAARVFLVLDENGLIQQDYHITVKPLPAS